MLEVKELNNREELDTFVRQSPNGNFMQSWDWSVYQEEGLGRKTYRLGMYDKEELVATAICYVIPQTFGPYAYCSRGPVLKTLEENLYKQVLLSLKDHFVDSGLLFVKVDPAILESSEISKALFEVGFKSCVNYVQPETPWITELSGSTEEDLFEWCKSHGMSKNYPTYIRKARREGLTVRFSKDVKDWEDFTKYLAKSSESKDFAIQGKDYYLKQLQYLGGNDIVRLAIVQLGDDPIAMLILSFYGDEVSCLYSAQTGMHTKLRGPMLLRWECMLQAQREGFKYFNSWDVLDDDKYVPTSSRYGYSNFKRGFGGYVRRYQRTADYPINKIKYMLVRLLDYYRKFRYYSDR